MITEQLMFIPPSGVLPRNPVVPLKKILLWNGASSWNGIRQVFSNYGIIWGEILRWILNDGIRVAHDTIIDRIVGIRLAIPVCDSVIDWGQKISFQNGSGSDRYMSEWIGKTLWVLSIRQFWDNISNQIYSACETYANPFLRPGRGELLKQLCPVSSCAITTNRSHSVYTIIIVIMISFIFSFKYFIVIITTRR